MNWITKKHTEVIEGYLVDWFGDFRIFKDVPIKEDENSSFEGAIEDERVIIMDYKLSPLSMAGYPVKVKITIETEEEKDKRIFYHERWEADE